MFKVLVQQRTPKGNRSATSHAHRRANVASCSGLCRTTWPSAR